MNEPNATYIFNWSTMLEALEDWEQEQVKNYPHQSERIQITVVAMQHFLRSSQIKDHKMIISGEPEKFELKMPSSWSMDDKDSDDNDAN